MAHRIRMAGKRQGGSALVITSVVLMVVTLLVVAAIRNSDRESTAGARSRATTRTLQAADAGVQLALNRLAQDPPNLNAFSVNLVDGVNLESRSRTQVSPVDLDQVGHPQEVAEEGVSVKVGGSAKYVARVFQVNVTSTGGGSTAEVEARLSRIGAEATGY